MPCTLIWSSVCPCGWWCYLLTRNDYLKFQKIIKLEYEFPDKFFPNAKDLVEQLLVSLIIWIIKMHSNVVPQFHTKTQWVSLLTKHCFIFVVVLGSLQPIRLWGDGWVQPSQSPFFLWGHHMGEPSPTDTPQTHPLPASHGWGWWGLLWKCRFFPLDI